MTLDEAIEHCRDNAKKECQLGKGNCAEEHKQLAEWLVELKKMKAENKKLMGYIAKFINDDDDDCFKDLLPPSDIHLSDK